MGFVLAACLLAALSYSDEFPSWIERTQDSFSLNELDDIEPVVVCEWKLVEAKIESSCGMRVSSTVN